MDSLQSRISRGLILVLVLDLVLVLVVRPALILRGIPGPLCDFITSNGVILNPYFHLNLFIISL